MRIAPLERKRERERIPSKLEESKTRSEIYIGEENIHSFSLFFHWLRCCFIFIKKSKTKNVTKMWMTDEEEFIPFLHFVSKVRNFCHGERDREKIWRQKLREKNTERKTEREGSRAMTSGKRESHEWALINEMKQNFDYLNS